MSEAKHIGQHLLARIPDGESCVSPGPLEEVPDCLREATAISLVVKVAEDLQRRGDLGENPLRLILFERAQRVESSHLLSPGQQRVVTEGEQRTPQGRKHAQLVLRSLDRSQGVPHTEHLLPIMKAASSNQDMGNVSNLQLPNKLCRLRLLEPAQASEQETDMACPDGYEFPTQGVCDRPPTLSQQEVQERAHRLGNRPAYGGFPHLSPLGVGLRDSQRNGRRTPRHCIAIGTKRNIVSLAPSLHRQRERPVDQILDPRVAAEAHAEVELAGATGLQLSLHSLVDSDVRAPEAIDGLLWVSNHEQLAGDRAHEGRIGHRGIVRSQQQDDVDLKGVRVLKLINQDVAKATLQLRPHLRRAHQKVAGALQQVNEVQSTLLLFGRGVPGHDGQQLLMKQRRQLRLAVSDQGTEVRSPLIPPSLHLGGGKPGTVEIAPTPVPQCPPSVRPAEVAPELDL